MLRQLRSRLSRAIVTKNEGEKDVLRLILGEVSTVEARLGKISEEQIHKVIRKILEGNLETLSLIDEKKVDKPEMKAKLLAENDILTALLPRNLEPQEVKNELLGLAEELKSVKNNGQAMGIAMKHFREKKLTVCADDVVQVIKEIRVW
jgi:uncharacterized protein YqeY